MNHYPHHIGDYLKDTAHLSLLEHGCYRRMLDVYYTRERPFTDTAEACKLIGARSAPERTAVGVVLADYFSQEADGWHQKRCDQEIEDYAAKAQANRTNGKLGGRPKKPKQNQVGSDSASHPNPETKPTGLPNGSQEQKPNGFKSETQKNLNQNQNQNQLNSEAKASGASAPPQMTPDEIIFGYGVPLLAGAGHAEKHARSFLGGLRKQHGDKAVVDALRDCLREKPLQPLDWLAAKLPPRATARSQEKSSVARPAIEAA